MCKCLDNMRQALEENKDYIDPQLQTVLMINIKAGKTIEKTIEKAGKLEFTYKTRKNNGEISKKTEKSFFNFSHCPFCGEAY